MHRQRLWKGTDPFYLGSVDVYNLFAGGSRAADDKKAMTPKIDVAGLRDEELEPEVMIAEEVMATMTAKIWGGWKVSYKKGDENYKDRIGHDAAYL